MGLSLTDDPFLYGENIMKPPSDMNNEQLVRWMTKTVASTNGALRSGNMSRKYDLVDRHSDLKEEMVVRDIWNKYCDDNGFSRQHDGWDCFA